MSRILKKFLPKARKFGGGKLTKALIEVTDRGTRRMDVYRNDERYEQQPFMDRTFGEYSKPENIREVDVRGREIIETKTEKGYIVKLLDKIEEIGKRIFG